MLYAYTCTKCEARFDIVKSLRDIDRLEPCPKCNGDTKRDFAPIKLHLSKTKVQHAEYNPGLGTVVKNQRHKEDLCKRMGVEPIGNDYGSGEKMQKKFEADREAKRNLDWEKFDGLRD